MSQITKIALEQSLKKLLKNKPLDKITISDITEDCGISRMTFYYHFKDIYDLLEWSFSKDADTILKGKKSYQTWQDGLLVVFLSLRENADFTRNVYSSMSRDVLERFLYKLTKNLLLDVVKEESAGLVVKDEDQEFIAEFYKYAFVGILLDWIRFGMKDEPQFMVKKLGMMLEGTFRRRLENLSLGKD